jgi:hypothetical protein
MVVPDRNEAARPAGRMLEDFEMSRTSSFFRLSLLVVCLFSTTALFAQATRTWVSGVGDDANPCSRTAPCKTFAGAISKTANNGEISVLDPGGYGAVTITKSITINGEGTLASILFSGTNGVNINGAGIRVTLRNLTLNGGGTGINGISISNSGIASSVTVENCEIWNFTSYGIVDNRNLASPRPILTVRNTSIHTGIGAPSYGIVFLNSNSLGRLDGVKIWRMSNAGLVLNNGSNVAASNSSFDSNLKGAYLSGGANGVSATFDNCQFTGNTEEGVGSLTNATARLSNCLITGNNNGLSIVGGVIESFGNNRIRGNTSNNGAGLTTVAQQ